jgi:hypothetical protein
MTRLGICLHVKKDKVQASLSIEIKPVVWAREGKRGCLHVPPIQIQLKNAGEIVRRKPYSIPLEGRIGLKPAIEWLI